MFKRNFDNAHHAAERRNSASFFDLLEETEGGEKETDQDPSFWPAREDLPFFCFSKKSEA